MKPRAWYRIVAQADLEAVDLYIFDEIGRSFWNDDAVGAKAFVDELRALPETVQTIHLHVNSPGGDPFEATAIANALRAQRTEKGRAVNVSIEGLAASAATIITSAGAPIRMADNALFMIHDPFALVIGPAADMRKMADALDKIRDSIVATYQWTSPLGAEELAALMAAETWMTAQEALDRGFATEVVDGVQAAASFRPEALCRLGTVPEAYRARVEALVATPAPPPPAADPKAVIQACKAAGFPELAEDLLGQSLDAVQAGLDQAKTARTVAEARATEIRALCAAAKVPELAESLILGGAPITAVKAQLTIVTAKLDQVEIDGQLPPDVSSTPAIKIAESYAALNRRAGQKE